MRRTALRLVAASAAVVAVAACTNSNAGGGTSADGGFTLKIGDVLPFTGDLSPYGPSLDKGSAMGIDMVNAALKADGLSSTKIELVGSEDDQTSTSAGVEAATKLVSIKKADVLVGSMSSGVTIAIAKSVAVPDDVLMVTPTSSDVGITQLADNGLVFRVYPPDDFQAKALVQTISQELGQDATLNVGGRNDAFGVALVNGFKAEWESKGGKVGKVVMYDPKSPTFDSAAGQLTSGSPKGFVIADFPATFAKVGPALVRTGKWSPKQTFMTEAMQNADELKKIGAQATVGLRGTAASANGGTGQDAFQSAFKSKYPKLPYTGFESSAFDSSVIASLAAIKAGTNDPSKVKEAMLTVSKPDGEKFTWQQLPEAIKAIKAGKTISYQGAWTQVAFDPKGDPAVSSFVLWQWTGSEIKTLKNLTFEAQ